MEDFSLQREINSLGFRWLGRLAESFRVSSFFTESPAVSIPDRFMKFGPSAAVAALGRLVRTWQSDQGSATSQRRRNKRGRRSLQFVSLESRSMLATIVLDYSFDTQGFFDNTAARNAIEDVAATISASLNDTLDAITPTGNNTWSQAFFHPGTGDFGTFVSNPTVNADEIVVYVGGSDLGGALGSAGPGGYSASGNQAWFDSIGQRGESGVASDDDFAPWGGSASFSTTANWHFGETTAGLDFNEFDFRSVAFHEFYHILGFASAGSWTARVDAVNSTFTGAATVAEFDGTGDVPLDAGLAHFAEGTTENGQEVSLDPTITNGTRKFPTALDEAVLTDIGWEVASPGIGEVFVSGNDLVVNGTSDVNLIEVRGSTGDLRILIDGFDHGTFARPSGQLIVNALDGNDEIRLQPLVSVNSVLNGGAGNDLIRGGVGVDTIYGGSGNDMLFGRDGNDSIFGEAGNDGILGMNGNDTIDGGSGTNTLTGGAGNDQITGGDQIDTIFGSAGNDTIYAGGGGDIISGGLGDDMIYGGLGDDEITGLSGIDTIYGEAGMDVILGGAGNDMLFGGTEDDEIRGGGGSDTIQGDAGNDMLFGDQATDFLFGGLGDDILYGGTSSDELHGGFGNDMLFGEGGVDFLFGDQGEDELRGGFAGDVLRGGDDDDVLDGEGGNDDLFGEAGNDTLTGGLAADLLNGGAGFDTALDSGERGLIDIEQS